MLVLLIVVPCVIIGVGVVALFDRTGVFSGIGGGEGAAGGGRPAELAEGIPRVVLIGGLVVMGGWVLAWVVFLIVGLGILSG